MFDIPQEYKLDILPTPPVLRGSIGAAYYPAPPFKKAGVGRFYLSPTGNDPARLKLNHRASIADTAIHEGFPGHDWHFKYITQHAAEISNIRWLTPGAVEDSSSMWSDSLATEGWGLYAEELMAEPIAGRPYGFYSAPEYLYELQGQMMRAVRVRVDVGIHTGRMTFNEARDYFVEHAEFYPGACGLTSADARAACDTAERAILPLLEMADAGDRLQPGQERHHRLAGGVQKENGHRVFGKSLSRKVHANGHGARGVLPRRLPDDRARPLVQ